MSNKIKLGEIATFINGKAFKPDDWAKSGYPIIRIQNLTDNTKEYNFYNGNLDQRYVVRKGDILISWSASLGVFEWDGEDAALNQHIFKVQFNKLDVDRTYFKYIASEVINEMIKYTHGSTMKHIVKKDFDNTKIPLPPLSEQRRIAEILDHADAIRRKNREILEKYNQLAQSVFFEMFGDIKINSNKYDIVQLSSVAHKITDGEHLTPKRCESGYKLLSARNIKFGYLDFNAGVDYVPESEFKRISKRCNPEFEDLLISCSGTIGRSTTIRIKEAFVLVRSVALIKPIRDKVNPYFLESYLNSKYMQSLMAKTANASSQANLFTGQIKKLPLLMPPFKMQELFADRLLRIEEQKNLVLESVSKSEELFQSLLQRAFKGEL